MKSIAYLIALSLVPGLAMGEAARTQPKPAAHLKPKVIDLDFTEDDDLPSSGSDGSSSAGSNQWVFWTLGATVVAGGVGGFLLYENGKEPNVTRNEQVFTDERP